jgi:hypothetical protein
MQISEGREGSPDNCGAANKSSGKEGLGKKVRLAARSLVVEYGGRRFTTGAKVNPLRLPRTVGQNLEKDVAGESFTSANSFSALFLIPFYRPPLSSLAPPRRS